MKKSELHVCGKRWVGKVCECLTHLHSTNMHSVGSFLSDFVFILMRVCVYPVSTGKACLMQCFCVPVVHVSAVPEFSLYPFLWDLPPGYKTTEPLAGP